MEPLFFGPATRQLFGAYEAPQGSERDAGVLVCNAGVHEYTRAHFAVRRLAGLIARQGYHVLRFDWLGTGDSGGDLSDATVERWCEDLQRSAGELRELSGVRRVSAVGYRLGAAIAARAASEGLELRDLVLWDPPLCGRNHLAELRAVDREQLSSMPWVDVDPHQFQGYALPRELQASIETLDLRRLAPCHADRIAVFAPAELPAHAELAAALRDRTGRPPTMAFVPDAPPARGAAFLPSHSIQAIVTALAGTTP